MSRSTKTVTISIPPEMDKQIETLMREEGRTRSELLREALRRYVEERRWRSLRLYAQEKAREKGITTEEQVNAIVRNRRAKKT